MNFLNTMAQRTSFPAHAINPRKPPAIPFTLPQRAEIVSAAIVNTARTRPAIEALFHDSPDVNSFFMTVSCVCCAKIAKLLLSLSTVK